jgi:histidinol-phosphate/aromatic aminotransferase/cobyric acid decarboxylase-like protein
MNYPGWGDGLRISVGTDEQNEALLGLLQPNLNDRADGESKIQNPKPKI